MHALAKFVIYFYFAQEIETISRMLKVNDTGENSDMG